MTATRMIAIGAILGALGVMIGAFGAHGLKSRVTADMLEIFETGVRYHFYHAIALVLLGLFCRSAGDTAPAGATVAALGFIVGTTLFSGSLYVLVLTGTKWLGAITPIGGVAFIVGWVAFARAALSA